MNATVMSQDAIFRHGEILHLIRQQNEMLARILNLLRRSAAQDSNLARKPRRSREQSRQLSIAIAEVQKDPLHNVRRAASIAFKMAKGYSSVHSLENALAAKWNTRVD